MHRRLVQGAALVLALSLAAPLVAAAQTPVNPPLMKVNGEVVSTAEVSLVLRDLRLQLRQLGQQPTEEQLVELATQKVVERKLLAQEARRRNLKPNEARVQKRLDDMVQRLGGRDKLDAFLTSGGTDYATVERMIREADLVEVLLQIEVEPKVSVTEDQIANYYRSNPEMFQVPETMRAQHVLVEVPDEADEAARTAALERAREVRRRAQAGEDFAALARELSDAPTAEKGGDLGFFSREQMPQALAEAAFALEPGQISTVVETPSGYHVIKAGERRAPTTRSLDEVHDRVQEMIFQRTIAEEMGEMVRTLHASAEVVPLIGGGAAPKARTPRTNGS